jgi:hypothetical protein
MSDRITISVNRIYPTRKTDNSLFGINIGSQKLNFTGIKYRGSGKGWITPTSCLLIRFSDLLKSPIVEQGFPDSACQSLQVYLISWSANRETTYHEEWRSQAKESGTTLLIWPGLSYSINK